MLVKVKENIVVAPRCRQIVLGRLESEKEQSPSTGFCGASSDTYRGNSPRACAITSRVEHTGTFSVTSQHSHTETAVVRT